MTEKQYGGSTGRETGKVVTNINKDATKSTTNKVRIDKSTSEDKNFSYNKSSGEEKIIKAGKIASETKKYAASIIKRGMPLLEIAEKIEAEIEKLGGKPAFPANLSIDNIAAHYTPSYDDKTIAQGLLKVDIGVSMNGLIADTAFSIDLENNDENKRLIKASMDALEKALKIVKRDVSTDEIGEIISKTIESNGFSPIINLSGHSMNKHELHSGITIPNINDKININLKEWLYEIEPFATTGS